MVCFTFCPNRVRASPFPACTLSCWWYSCCSCGCWLFHINRYAIHKQQHQLFLPKLGYYCHPVIISECHAIRLVISWAAGGITAWYSRSVFVGSLSKSVVRSLSLLCQDLFFILNYKISIKCECSVTHVGEYKLNIGNQSLPRDLLTWKLTRLKSVHREECFSNWNTISACCPCAHIWAEEWE